MYRENLQLFFKFKSVDLVHLSCINFQVKLYNAVNISIVIFEKIEAIFNFFKQIF